MKTVKYFPLQVNESLLAMSLVSNDNIDNSDTLTHARDNKPDSDEASSANKGKEDL